MFIRLFDIRDGGLIPSEHCHTLGTLKAIMEEFPDNYVRVYLYIFYKTCSDPAMNPFFNLQEEEREEAILHEIKADFSLDNPVINEAVALCERLYDTPTKRAYDGAKAMMDKLATLFKTGSLTTGRDGSLDSIVRTMEKYQKLRESFKGVEKDYLDEIKAQTRGGSYVAYDQQ